MIVRPFLFRGKEHNFLFSWKKLNINHHIHIPQWSNFSSKVLQKIHTLFQKILWNKKRAGISKIILCRSLSHFLYSAYNKNSAMFPRFFEILPIWITFALYFDKNLIIVHTWSKWSSDTCFGKRWTGMACSPSEVLELLSQPGNSGVGPWP